MITENTKRHLCEHLEKAMTSGVRVVRSYVTIYAGESVRIDLCRLCSTMALGTIISERIKEAIDPSLVEKHDYI